jgi:hypothetical protein
MYVCTTTTVDDPPVGCWALAARTTNVCSVYSVQNVCEASLCTDYFNFNLHVTVVSSCININIYISNLF